jgi:hypothetical protein
LNARAQADAMTAAGNTVAARGLRETDFMGWPALALQQGALALHVVPAVGGRLMGIAFDDEELCFVNPALHGRLASDDAGTWSALCGDWDFPLWGGGKTWLAPESAWPGGAPHRDLDSGVWTLTERWIDDTEMGVALRSPVCRDSGLQLHRRIRLSARGPQWQVEQTVRNCSDGPRRCGLWDVLMLRRPAQVFVALPKLRRTDWRSAVRTLPGKGTVDALLRDGVLHHSGDCVDIACTQPGMFKCGFDSDAGEIGADLPVAGGTLRYSRRSAVPAGARYAHGHPLEVYNAPALPYFEIESHSPAVTLQPGECAAFRVEEAVQRLSHPPTEGAHT